MGNKKEVVTQEETTQEETTQEETTQEETTQEETTQEETTQEETTQEETTQEETTQEETTQEEPEEEPADNKVQKYVVAKCDRVYVRKSHTKESEPVDSLPSGTVVFGREIIKDVTDAWVKVSYNDGENTGYIMRKYLTREVKA